MSLSSRPASPSKPDLSMGLQILALLLAPIACFNPNEGDDEIGDETETTDESGTDTAETETAETETAETAETETAETETAETAETETAETTETETGMAACGDGSADPGELCLADMPEVMPIGIPALRLAAGQFDEHPGVAIVGGTPQIAVVRGKGDLTFEMPELFQVAEVAISVAAGDLDNDGDDDIATHGSGVNVMLNQGMGMWQTVMVDMNGGLATDQTRIVIGQFDGVAQLDYAFGDGYNTVWRVGNAWNGWSPGSVGDGQYTGGDSWIAVTEWGFDGDGFTDLAVASRWVGEVAITRGTGAPDFMDHGFAPVCGPDPCDITELHIDDLDADGNPDLITSITDNLSVVRGKGDGTFELPVLYPLPGADRAVTGDVDDDGDLDVLVASTANGDLHLLLGDGSGALAEPIVFETPASSLRTAGLVDLNGDGALELLAAYDFNGGGWLAVFEANP